LLFLITTFAAWMLKSVQMIILLSMIVLATLIVFGPVYVVRIVPIGTPVLFGPGQQVPVPSGPPGTCVAGPEQFAEGRGIAVCVNIGDCDGAGKGFVDGEGEGAGALNGVKNPLAPSKICDIAIFSPVISCERNVAAASKASARTSARPLCIWLKRGMLTGSVAPKAYGC
jgi:hypothetical protein